MPTRKTFANGPTGSGVFILVFAGTVTSACVYPHLDGSEVSATTGGTPSNGGAKSSGGVTSTAGNAGNSSAAGHGNGGAPGGASSTAGGSNGTGVAGASASGGSNPIGGTTGGTLASAGGQSNLGGTSPSATGGVKASGGATSATAGGATNAGGANSTGGTKTTGGANPTGGNSSAAGAAANLATSLSANFAHTCAVVSSGKVQCWGDDSEGELGYTNSSDCGISGPCSLVPNPVTNLVNASTTLPAAVASGAEHTCVIVTGGAVQCWGYNGFGQIGISTATSQSTTPVSVPNLSNAVALGAGARHSCAVINDGSIRCWGGNSYGQLGNNSTTDSAAPVAVSTLSTASAVAAGFDHTCAVLGNGTVMCWGTNDNGQLGISTSTTRSLTPIAVNGISTASGIAAGSYFTCASLNSGQIRCWGYNGTGQLGNGTTATQSASPVAVPSISTASMVATGDSTTCVVLQSGAVQCWGMIIGNGGFTAATSSSAPVTVSGVSNATAVTTGNYHSCALLTGARLACWGDNTYGELGDGTTASSTPAAYVNGF